MVSSGAAHCEAVAKSSTTEARSGLTELCALSLGELDALSARLLPLLLAAPLFRAACTVRRLIVPAVAIARLSAVSTRRRKRRSAA